PTSSPSAAASSSPVSRTGPIPHSSTSTPLHSWGSSAVTRSLPASPFPPRPRRLLSLGLVDAPRRPSVARRSPPPLHPWPRLAPPPPPPEPVLRAGVRAGAGVRLPLPAPGPLATESRLALSDRHRARRLSLPHLRGRDDLPRRRLPALRASAPARLLASGRRV